MERAVHAPPSTQQYAASEGLPYTDYAGKYTFVGANFKVLIQLSCISESTWQWDLGRGHTEHGGEVVLYPVSLCKVRGARGY